MLHAIAVTCYRDGKVVTNADGTVKRIPLANMLGTGPETGDAGAAPVDTNADLWWKNLTKSGIYFDKSVQGGYYKNAAAGIEF